MRRNNWITCAIAQPTVQARRSDDCLEKRTEDGALSFRAHRVSETTPRSNCEIPSRSVFVEARARARSSAFREVPRLGFALTITCTLLAHLRKCLIINGAGEGNRTLVIITKAPSRGKSLFSVWYSAEITRPGTTVYHSVSLGNLPALPGGALALPFT